MRAETRSREPQRAPVDSRIAEWRYEQLVDAGVSIELADQLSTDWRFDLHVLIELIECGCEPGLAVRILAPLDQELSTDTTSASREIDHGYGEDGGDP